jgi:hypothetical protein
MAKHSCPKLALEMLPEIAQQAGMKNYVACSFAAASANLILAQPHTDHIKPNGERRQPRLENALVGLG